MAPPRYPCGAESNSAPEERWKDEISCTLVGCRGCKNFNGTEYYQANIKKGVAMWARKELEGRQ
jgi:hypothetical protein